MSLLRFTLLVAAAIVPLAVRAESGPPLGPLERGLWHLLRNEPYQARERLEFALAQDPSDLAAQNELAWLLATSDAPGVSHRRRSRALADDLCQRDQRQLFLATRAVATAACGELELAEEILSQAEEKAGRNQELLSSFRTLRRQLPTFVPQPRGAQVAANIPQPYQAKAAKLLAACAAHHPDPRLRETALLLLAELPPCPAPPHDAPLWQALELFSPKADGIEPDQRAAAVMYDAARVTVDRGLARVLLKAAAQLDPHRAEIHLALATADERQGLGAMRHVLAAYWTAPSDELRSWLGRWHVVRGEHDLAAWYHNQLPKNARPGEDRLFEWLPTLERGLVLLRQRKIAQAAACFRHAWFLERNPQGLHWLGVSWQMRGDFETAEQCFWNAVTANPQAIETRNELAWLMITRPDRENRDVKLAVKVARSNLKKAGPDPLLLDTMAAAYAATGDFERARTSIEMALEQLPETSERREELEIRRALYVLEKPFESSGEAALAVGRAMLGSDAERATRLLKRAAKLLPEEPEPRFLLCLAELAVGSKESAQNQLQALVESHPDFLPAADQLACLLLQSGSDEDVSQALSLAQRACQRSDFGRGEFLATLAMAEHASGNLAAAMQHAEQSEALLRAGGMEDAAERVHRWRRALK